MKKISILAGLTFVAAGAIAADQVHEPSSVATAPIQGERSGQDIVVFLREGLQSGRYDAMLSELEADYQQMLGKKEFNEFVSLRESTPVDDQLKEAASHWEVQHRKLIDTRNQSLVAAVKGENTLSAKRIASITSSQSQDQKEALRYLSSLRFMTPDGAANADEKKLIEIDLASEFKMVHLDAQYAVKPFDDRSGKQIVLKMDMLKRMLEASQTFQDKVLKKKVELASDGFDQWQARNLDLIQLNAMIKKPSNDQDRQIAGIMNQYKAQKEDLYQKEFVAKLDGK